MLVILLAEKGVLYQIRIIKTFLTKIYFLVFGFDYNFHNTTM